MNSNGETLSQVKAHLRLRFRCNLSLKSNTDHTKHDVNNLAKCSRSSSDCITVNIPILKIANSMPRDTDKVYEVQREKFFLHYFLPAPSKLSSLSLKIL